MLVANQYGVQLFWVFPAKPHALDDFSATESSIQDNTSLAGGDNRAIPF